MALRGPLLLLGLLATVRGGGADRREGPRAGAAIEVRVPSTRSLYVPPGWFTFGATAEEQAAALALCRADLGTLEHVCVPDLFVGEGPPRRTYVPGFYLDREEVTVAAYRRCVDAGRCDPRPLIDGDPRLADPRLPVTSVSWSDADRYCAFVGGRLPSEVEWERAARGPTPRVFPWGGARKA